VSSWAFPGQAATRTQQHVVAAAGEVLRQAEGSRGVSALRTTRGVHCMEQGTSQ
jgi:hypothetical protein